MKINSPWNFQSNKATQPRDVRGFLPLGGRPTFSANFETGTYSGLTYAGTGRTVVNSDGYTVAADCPRIDYDPVTLAVKGLFVEKASTTLVRDDWGQLTYLASVAATTPAAGGLCNERVTFTASSAACVAKYAAAGNSTFQYTVIARVKAASKSVFYVTLRNAAQSIGIQYNVNLTTLVLTDASYGSPTSKITPTITLVGGGEYVITFGGVLNAGGGAENIQTFVLNGYATAGTLDVGAAQVEVSAFATSTIFNPASASRTVTMDEVNISEDAFASMFNPLAGTFFIKFIPGPIAAGDRGLFDTDNPGAGTYCYIRGDNDKVQLNATMSTAAVEQGEINLLAITYDADGIRMSLNGEAVVSNATTFGDLDEEATYMTILRKVNGEPQNGHCLVFNYWNTATTDNTDLRILSGYVVPPPTPPFEDPTDIANLAFWLDATDDATITGDPDTSITEIVDKGPSEIVCTAYDTTTRNVDGYLESAGSNFELATPVEFLDDFHVFLLIDIKSAVNGIILSSNQGALAPYLYYYGDGTGFDLLLRSDGGFNENNPRNAPAITGKMVIDWHFQDHDNLQFYQDGVAATITSPLTGTASLNRFTTIGWLGAPSNGINAGIAVKEIVMYDGNMTSGEIEAVRAYLTARK